ncbi:hypothetical protein SAMD00023353_0500430 [Rosellinia necatrix]|uniref:Uncharacterized protein n=1 Tax=Rosellinia necatrix TaxID=77044 RepID=A0A1S8A5G2_ROSNE|nr:hypothetical protein SAMD00023353_0500430 [Rosellinia necatrix]
MHPLHAPSLRTLSTHNNRPQTLPSPKRQRNPLHSQDRPTRPHEYEHDTKPIEVTPRPGSRHHAPAPVSHVTINAAVRLSTYGLLPIAVPNPVPAHSACSHRRPLLAPVLGGRAHRRCSCTARVHHTRLGWLRAHDASARRFNNEAANALTTAADTV